MYHLRHSPLPHLLQLVLLAKLTFPHLKVKIERERRRWLTERWETHTHETYRKSLFPFYYIALIFQTEFVPN